MKKVILSAIALFAFGFANAQDSDGGFQVGIHLGLPMGDIKDLSSFNAGLDLGYMWPAGEGFEIGVATGYDNFFAKDYEAFGVTIKGEDAAFIPLAGALKYSVTENFFVGADLGYAFYAGSEDGAEGGFYYQPKVGYQMSEVDVFVGYKGISSSGVTFSAVTLGAAYKF